MKKEAKLLLEKAVDSLLLSIEHFNRPWDRGRIEAVLILFDHSFEMLLKASILHRGGRIREPRARQTLGFDHCVRKGLSDGDIKFLKEEQALSLQMINSLRDAAQHHLIEISEHHLYIQAQAGLTLFKDIYKKVFDRDLKKELPERVLPIASSPPTDLTTLFDNETKEIKKLLKPGSRKKIEARARLRSLAIVEGAISGERVQPSKTELDKLCNNLGNNEAWNKLFPGVASINLSSDGEGPSLNLRISKKEGIPIQLVEEGTPGATVVAIKRVDELGFYSLGHEQLAKKVGLTSPKLTALIRYKKLHEDTECCKKISIGKSKFTRYSQKAINKIQEILKNTPIDEVWEWYKNNK